MNINDDFTLTLEDNYELFNLENIFLAKIDTKGFFIRINENMNEFLHFPNSKLNTKPFFKYFPKIYQNQFEKLGKVKTLSRFVDTFTFKGDTINIVWSMYTKHLPDHYYLIGNGNTLFFKEVTDIINKEKTILDNMIQQTMPYFIAELGSGKLMEYNDQFAKIMNFEPNKDYIGLEMKNYWQSPEDRQEFFNHLQEHESVYNYHAKVADYRGKPMDVIVNTQYLYDKNNKINSLQVVMSYNAMQANFITKIFENNALLELKIKERTKHLVEVNQLLDSNNVELEKKNIVLNELIYRLQHSEENLNRTVSNNIRHIILPILYKLKVDESINERTIKLIENIEENLNSITSNFGNSINDKLNDLSKREIEIANFVKSGLSSKEIGKILSISETTVVSHRNRIRKKLNLSNTRTNLTTYLNSL